ncbi:hypothetical protein RintRC_5222 [Richelia intracellularis]|nr:hypothetical protein RintRC_5222 [Richelia intracellularis]
MCTKICNFHYKIRCAYPEIVVQNHIGATLLVRRGVELRQVLEEVEGY